MQSWILALAFAALTCMPPAEARVRQPMGAVVDVDVYLAPDGAMWRSVSQAKAIVSKIFANIDVKLVWHSGLQPAEPNATGRPAFAIRWVERAPASAGAGVLAAAHPFCSPGPAITFYEDRTRQWLERHRDAQSVSLAYAFAHELAHVMQGLARHSDSGILKAQWNEADRFQMILRKLAFTSYDAELIHDGLEARISGRCSSLYQVVSAEFGPQDATHGLASIRSQDSSPGRNY